MPVNGCFKCNASRLTHQHQIGRADRRGHRVDVAPAEPCQLGLAADRQCVVTVPHRFALSYPTLVSAPSKKSFSSVSCPILACNAFKSTGGSTAKDLGRSRAEFPFPPCNLIGMYVKPLCQFSQRFIAANATLDLNTAECVRLVLFAIFCSLSSPRRAINGSRFST